MQRIDPRVIIILLKYFVAMLIHETERFISIFLTRTFRIICYHVLIVVTVLCTMIFAYTGYEYEFACMLVCKYTSAWHM